MTNEELSAEIQSLRLDLEHLSGVTIAQTMVIRLLLKQNQGAREKIDLYFSQAANSDHGGGFSAEQLRAINQTLNGLLL